MKTVQNVMKPIDAEVLAVLRNLQWQDGCAQITQTLSRPLYQKVNKVLLAASGKWDKKHKAHVFDGDGELAVRNMVATGYYTETKSLLNFFPTPMPLAVRMCQLAGLTLGDRVLEPSAGSGNLCRAVAATGASPFFVELDDQHQTALEDFDGWFGDFMEFDNCGTLFNAVVMNPPFRNQQDMQHVLRAWEMVQPGGTLVAVVSPAYTYRMTKQADAFRAWLDQYVVEEQPLDPGTFKESGTLVATRLVVARKDGASRGSGKT